MKKIIAAFDGLKFSVSTRDYAIQISQTNDAHLVGVFLDDHTSYKIYDLIKENWIKKTPKQEPWLLKVLKQLARKQD